jgi:hypothetical protein
MFPGSVVPRANTSVTSLHAPLVRSLTVAPCRRSSWDGWAAAKEASPMAATTKVFIFGMSKERVACGLSGDKRESGTKGDGAVFECYALHLYLLFNNK